MADTPTGETVTPEAPSPEVTPVAAPSANAADPAELERLKKDKEKSDLRIRQLENEAAARKKADDEAKTEELAKKEQYKELFEAKDAEAKELAAEIAAGKHKAALRKLRAEALAEQPEEVKALVKELGVELTDESDEAVADFKTKVEAAAKRIGSAKVTANNPGQPAPAGQPTGQALREILLDPVKRDEYYRQKGGVAEMMMDK